MVATGLRVLANLERELRPYPLAYDALILTGLLLLAWLANWLSKRVLVRGLHGVLRRLRGAADDDQDMRLQVVPRLANVIPALVLSLGVGSVPHLPPQVIAVIQSLCHAFIALTVALAVARALDVVNHVYERRADARNRPIKGYLQVAKIVLFVLAGLAIVAILAGVRFVHVVTGLGAMTAVLILVFQDTLLSLVASVQISSDGRVRIGDWIEMPSQNADGTVTDIALHTITVQNWDMTISTVPTKKLISESFKNWRGMYESGGRRIKRSIRLDQHSVRFLDEEELARLRRLSLLSPHLEHIDDEARRWQTQCAAQGVEPVQPPHPTNLGLFRSYVERYLRLNPHVRQDMLLLVRQLQPDGNGLPLEIWCFGKDTGIVDYERLQGDLLDHLLALLPLFDLRVFQVSSDSMLERADGSTQPPRNRVMAAIGG